VAGELDRRTNCLSIGRLDFGASSRLRIPIFDRINACNTMKYNRKKRLTVTMSDMSGLTNTID
jgi:hypothetical protein